MSVKVIKQESRLGDTLKWIVAAAIVVAGLFANTYFAAQPASVLALGWIALVAAVLVVAGSTTKGQLVRGFMRDARSEMRKVVWPGRQETIRTTLIVMAMILITTVFLWVVDSLLAWVVQYFLP